MAAIEIVSVTMSLEEQLDFVMQLLGGDLTEEERTRRRGVLRVWANDLLLLHERALVSASVQGMNEAAKRLRGGSVYAPARRRTDRIKQIVAATPAVEPDRAPVDLQVLRQRLQRRPSKAVV